MKKNVDSFLIITTLICLLPILLGGLLYPVLPDQVAVHFNQWGDPDGYAPKAAAVLGFPILFAALNLFTHFMLNHDPKKRNVPPIMIHLSKCVIPVLAVTIFPVMLFVSLGYEISIPVVTGGFIGLMIIVIGNYLPKCRQNYTVGIKLPWTLNSEENWRRTHRMAGYLWVIGGIALIAVSCVRLWTIPLLIADIMLISGIPALYSYWLYKKGI